jgi:protein-S-isoprenylcysteine O-methyltransferase Ste14
MTTAYPIAVAIVVGVAVIRTCIVSFGAVRMLLNRKRMVEERWGWVEILGVPELVLLPVLTYFLASNQPPAAELGLPQLGAALLAALLALAAAALSLWAGATFPSVTTGHYVLEDHQVVSDGPYGWVRHPIYVGVFMIWISLALAFASPIALLITLAYVIPIYCLYMREEEDMLKTQLGEEYLRYFERVGMLFPRLHQRRTPQHSDAETTRV